MPIAAGCSGLTAVVGGFCCEKARRVVDHRTMWCLRYSEGSMRC